MLTKEKGHYEASTCERQVGMWQLESKTERVFPLAPSQSSSVDKDVKLFLAIICFYPLYF